MRVPETQRIPETTWLRPEQAVTRENRRPRCDSVSPLMADLRLKNKSDWALRHSPIRRTVPAASTAAMRQAAVLQAATGAGQAEAPRLPGLLRLRIMVFPRLVARFVAMGGAIVE